MSKIGVRRLDEYATVERLLSVREPTTDEFETVVKYHKRSRQDRDWLFKIYPHLGTIYDIMRAGL